MLIPGLSAEGISLNGQNAATSGNNAQELEVAAHSSEPTGHPTPESLAEMMSSTRQMLVEQATESEQLAGQLQSQSSLTDQLERSRIQSVSMRSGAMFQNLGALLLELGRVMMNLRMGRTADDALVNAGSSEFVSSTGANPIMVQPLPFQPGPSIGSVPIGSTLTGGSAGTGLLPRNICIRLRAGSLGTSGSQPQGQAGQIPSNPTESDQQVLYPVLARVQHVSLGNSSGTRASHGTDSHNHNPDGNSARDCTTPEQNILESGANDTTNSLPSEAPNIEGVPSQTRGGLEQLLSSIFPQEHIISDDNADHSTLGSALPSHTDAAASGIGQESAPASTEEGILLSNMLRQILPMISENVSEPVISAEEQQIGDTCLQEPSSKRQRRE